VQSISAGAETAGEEWSCGRGYSCGEFAIVHQRSFEPDDYPSSLQLPCEQSFTPPPSGDRGRYRTPRCRYTQAKISL
jgi:hypothetical protein